MANSAGQKRKPRKEALNLLLTRRSVVANKLGAPGPNAKALEKILTAGTRVPDHKGLAPWRLIVFKGKARADFGKVLVSALKAQDPEMNDQKEVMEAGRFLRAPVVVAVISRVEMGAVPEWEQILSAGAVCQNLLHAATAYGFAGQWITEWYAYDPAVAKALGLAGNERVAGFVYIGTPQHQPTERRRPDLADVVSTWEAPASATPSEIKAKKPVAKTAANRSAK